MGNHMKDKNKTAKLNEKPCIQKIDPAIESYESFKKRWILCE